MEGCNVLFGGFFDEVRDEPPDVVFDIIGRGGVIIPEKKTGNLLQFIHTQYNKSELRRWSWDLGIRSAPDRAQQILYCT